jgi:hypothetical protein
MQLTAMEILRCIGLLLQVIFITNALSESIALVSPLTTVQAMQFSLPASFVQGAALQLRLEKVVHHWHCLCAGVMQIVYALVHVH